MGRELWSEIYYIFKSKDNKQKTAFEINMLLCTEGTELHFR